MNGHGSGLSRRKRSRHRDARRAASQSPDREEGEEKGNTARRLLKRRTARAAVNKIKLLEASLSDEDCEEENPRRSSGRLRSSRRPAVIQSSSESEGASAHGTQSRPFSEWEEPVCGHSDRCSSIRAFSKTPFSLFSLAGNKGMVG